MLRKEFMIKMRLYCYLQGLYGSAGNEVTGALIVAEGADNSVTVRKIQEAVMALFQIDAHKIRIMKMK